MTAWIFKSSLNIINRCLRGGITKIKVDWAYHYMLAFLLLIASVENFSTSGKVAFHLYVIIRLECK